LTVAENPGGIYTWTKSGSTTPLSNNRTLKVTQTGTYIVDVLACAGQFSAKDSVVVDVEPAPTAVIQSVGATTVCKGQGSVSLTATGQTGATFKWDNGSTGTFRNVNTDSVHTFDYFCYSYNACGDSTISNKIKVIVNDIPVAPTISHSQGVYTASSTTAHWFYKLKGTTVWKDAGIQAKIYTPTNLSVGDSVAAREKENDCFSVYSNAELFGSIGISNVNNPDAELGIYPNPNNGVFFLSFSEINSMNVELSIRNMIGQEVLQKSMDLNGNHIEEIDLSSVESGFYMLTVSNGEQRYTRRVVIQ
ncbi:MAG: hypothetical protein CL840_05405, partial [Crocinitomicaceae bacterium]|nr:hypothetical protein [Crocinitomicaceae bacterium]